MQVFPHALPFTQCLAVVLAAAVCVVAAAIGAGAGVLHLAASANVVLGAGPMHLPAAFRLYVPGAAALAALAKVRAAIAAIIRLRIAFPPGISHFPLG
jgi:hypothetical protein